MEEFLTSEENLFQIKIKEKTEEKLFLTINDDFELDIDLKNLKIETNEDFLIELCQNLNKLQIKDPLELLKTLSKSYGELMDPDSPLYKGQEVFELENDNNDIKFVDRIRFKEEDFHQDLWINVFMFLEPFTLLSFSRVSKLWMKLTRDEELWKFICQKQGLKDLGDQNTWRDLFKAENENDLKWTVYPSHAEKISDYEIRIPTAKTIQYIVYTGKIITDKTPKFKVNMKMTTSSGWVGLGLTMKDHINSENTWDGTTNCKSFIYSYNGYKWSCFNDENAQSPFPTYGNDDIITIEVNPQLKIATFFKNNELATSSKIELPSVISAVLYGNGDGVKILKKNELVNK